MSMARRGRLGIVLISSLAIMVIVLIMVFAVIKTSERGLSRASHYSSQVRALQAARAGVNELVAVFEQNRGYHNKLIRDIGGASYKVTFERDEPYFSVNNLLNSNVAADKSFGGYEVAPRSADILVVGQSGLVKRILRVVLRNRTSSIRSAGAVGKVHLAGDVNIGGIKSLILEPGNTAPSPAPGGIFSKYVTQSGSDQAVDWDGNGNFVMGDDSIIETAPAKQGFKSVSNSLWNEVPDKIQEHGAAESIVDIDIEAKISEGLSTPQLALANSVLKGYVNVSSPSSVPGDLTINGDLILQGGTLYVDGNLKINGSIEGEGSVFVKGDASVRGGNAIVQVTQAKGTALMAGGDILLEGLDAQDYLQDLLGNGTPGHAKLVELEQKMEAYSDAVNAEIGSDPVGYTTNLQYLSGRLAKKYDPSGPITDYWISPLTAPDGTHPYASSDAPIIAVLKELQSAPGFSSDDPKAQKLVSSLEKMQYFFRHNYDVMGVDASGKLKDGNSVETFTLGSDYYLYTGGGAGTKVSATAVAQPGFLRSGEWDDDLLEPKFWTSDHLARLANFDTNNPFGVTEVMVEKFGGVAAQYSKARSESYFQNNPLGFSWLGNSSFQGLVYARGSIKVASKFKVIGSLLSLGDIELKNNSELIYNEEYQDLLGERLPLGVVYIEDL